MQVFYDVHTLSTFPLATEVIKRREKSSEKNPKPQTLSDIETQAILPSHIPYDKWKVWTILYRQGQTGFIGKK